MKTRTINSGQAKLGEVYSFLHLADNDSKEEIISEIEEDIPEEVRDDLFYYKSSHRRLFSWFIFNRESKLDSYKYDEDLVNSIIEESILNASEYIDSPINIVLFPNFDTFYREELRGCLGISPGENTIFISYYPSKDWKEGLKATVLHELAHAISPFYNQFNLTIGGWIVLDGIAQNFVEENGIEPNKFAKSLDKETAYSILDEIEPKLDSVDKNFHQELFYGGEKYEHGTGYCIGYYLISDYLNSLDTVNWKELLHRDPKDILEVALEGL